MENRRNTQNIDVKYLVSVLLRHWPLIIITILVCLSVAIVYLKLSSKTYRVGTKIVINAEDQRQGGGSGEYFDVTEMMSQNRSFQNELALLQSTSLIKEVVDDMNLNVSYYIQEGRVPIPKELFFTLTDLYKQSPFIVIMDEDHPQPINILFEVNIRDDETFGIGGGNESAVIYDFKNKKVVFSGINFSLQRVTAFGETIENEYCAFKVLLNSNYNADRYLGKQLFFEFIDPSGLEGFIRNTALSLRANERESTIVDLSFDWGNIAMGVDFLNGLVNKYIERNLETKNRLANNTIEYIDQQLSNISGTLGRSEQELQNFRSSYELMNIDEKTRTLSQQIYDLGRARDEMESTYRTLVQIRDYFEVNKDNPNFVAPSVSGIEDEVLRNLMQEMAELTVEKQDLISKNQLMSPRLKTINSTIGNIKRVISENLNFNISSAEKELKDIESRISVLNREFSRLPQTQRRLVGIEREYNITDAAYSALLNKRIEAQIIKASNVPDCEILEPVSYQGVVSPNSRNVIALAIALGLLIPMLYVLARIYLTDKINNLEELKRFTSLKQVGIIPHSTANKNNIIFNEEQTPVAEAFHALRSNLVYYLLGEPNKTILVTSAIPAEGKSFTSLNLATSFASTHNNTLLMSFDLRKGSRVFSELKAKALVGISSYIINRATLDEIIIPTGIPNLDFIDNGEIPPDPVALISSPRTKELFTILKKRYDYIIVDTAPYDVFTDSFLLMQFADIKLFVSRIGTVTRRALRSCMNDIALKEIDNIYMVLNDVKNLNASKYSYYKEKKKKSWVRRLFRRKK